jgi:glycosyltransferase involved in cell wall biosynthesis
VHFVIAGTGDDLEEYRGRMVHPDRFTVVDRRLSEGETSVLFREAWLVALPYLEASQSGVAAIAMAYGVPAVATTVGSLPEAVKDGRSGSLVPPGDADALADAIASILLNRQTRARLAEGARDLAVGVFSWAHVAELTEKVYMEATEE